MKLLDEIQTAVLDSHSDLSGALRRAKILARQVGSRELEAWVDQELGGYSNTRELPSYRVFSATPLGHLLGPLGREIQNFPIPRSAFPEGVRGIATRVPLGHSVRELEALSSSEDLRQSWPPELVAILRQKFKMTDGSQLVDVYNLLPPGVIEGVLAAIRNRLLDFILTLKDQLPEEIRRDSLSSNARETVNKTLHVTILGNQNTVAAGEHLAVTTSNLLNIDALLSQMESIGVDAESREALKKAIVSDGPPKKAGVWGPGVRGWFKSMIDKVTVDLPISLLEKLLLAHYGWPQS